MLLKHKNLYSLFSFFSCFLFWGCSLQFSKVYEYEDAKAQIGKRIAIFPAYTELIHGNISFPEGLRESLEKKVIESLVAKGRFEKVLHGEELDAYFQNDGELFQKKEIYLDTLYSASLSDNDLSAGIGQALDVDSFVVFHISYWEIKECKNFPCVKGSGEENYDQRIAMRIKLRVLEQATGKPVWLAIHELDSFPLDTPLEFQEAAYEFTDNMMKRLYDDFYTQILEPVVNAQSIASLL